MTLPIKHSHVHSYVILPEAKSVHSSARFQGVVRPSADETSNSETTPVENVLEPAQRGDERWDFIGFHGNIQCYYGIMNIGNFLAQ